MNIVTGWYRPLAALLAALALACAVLPAHGAELSAADEKRVHDVVQAQLDAFAADDARRAFSYAAPNIREMFRNADNFMAMVRGSYPVVYRPASVAFLKPEQRQGEVVQRVRMTDADARAWIAVYTLQKQKDNAWRITGCVLAESKGRVA